MRKGVNIDFSSKIEIFSGGSKLFISVTCANRLSKLRIFVLPDGCKSLLWRREYTYYAGFVLQNIYKLLVHEIRLTVMR